MLVSELPQTLSDCYDEPVYEKFEPAWTMLYLQGKIDDTKWKPMELVQLWEHNELFNNLSVYSPLENKIFSSEQPAKYVTQQFTSMVDLPQLSRPAPTK